MLTPSTSWKTGVSPNTVNLADKIQPLSFVLQAPEEQTDNWDDDFEEGISFTKLQGNIVFVLTFRWN